MLEKMSSKYNSRTGRGRNKWNPRFSPSRFTVLALLEDYSLFFQMMLRDTEVITISGRSYEVRYTLSEVKFLENKDS